MTKRTDEGRSDNLEGVVSSAIHDGQNEREKTYWKADNVLNLLCDFVTGDELHNSIYKWRIS